MSKAFRNMDLDYLIRGGGQLPELEHNSVHVWRIHTSVTLSSLQVLEGFLAPDERARTGTYYFERDRRRFAVCRGCLRLLAAAYSGKDPAGIRFCFGPHGKPELSDAPSQQLRFNVAHSGEVALLAFALDCDIGVDVEIMRLDLDFASLAETSFSKAEHAAVVALPPERRADLFFQYWTCKEACTKADGRGLSVPLDQFSVVPSQEAQWREIIVTGTGCVLPEMRIRILDLDSGYAAAVAAAGTEWDALQMDLE